MKQKLDFLKDKLSDLSRRNRSIRLMKLYDKYTIDIYELITAEGGPTSDLLDQLLQGKTKQMNIVARDSQIEAQQILSQKLTTLYRNLKAIEEETGMYDFSFGYPFLTGAMQDGTFFRGPLFLFPFRLEKTARYWVLERSDEEPIVNRTLLLALKKLNQFAIDDSMFDETTSLAIQSIADAQRWFQQYGYHFPIASETLQKCKNYTLKTVPELEKGQIFFDHLAVLGLFPQGSSAIQKDYDLLKALADERQDLGMISQLLFDLDTNATYDALAANLETKQQSEIPEAEQLFLLPTDGSQEQILQLVRSEEGLVVHGPPGTGKSQVIVNLITDALNREKRILVVCQKRAALDVVYQRLDSLGLGSITSLIHDEKNDRTKFYQKLKTGLETTWREEESSLQEYQRVSEKVANSEAKLTAIAKALFTVQDFGYRAYDLYSLSTPQVEMKHYLNVKSVLPHFSRNTLEDQLQEVRTYAEFYQRFGAESYPWKQRQSFSQLELSDQAKMTTTLSDLIDTTQKIGSYLHQFEQQTITPEYARLIAQRIEKIYPDLTQQQQGTLSNIKIWLWNNFTGKQILQELLQGEPLPATSSSEWIKVKNWLVDLHELAILATHFEQQIQILAPYLQEQKVHELSQAINKETLPLADLQQLLVTIQTDFEDLRMMNRFEETKPDHLIAVIELVKAQIQSNEQGLPNQWVQAVRDSIYLTWIEQVEKIHPQLELISTSEFARIREEFTRTLDLKQTQGKLMLQSKLLKKRQLIKQKNPRAMKELAHQVGKRRQVWPIRKLIQTFAEQELLTFMPVWLVSPEIASSIFPLSSDLFDLVIFDEASQCTVESGLPTIYRGKQVVIAGDEMQLPPSNLFKGTSEIDEDDEETFEIDDSKSLLNLAKRHFNEQILQWHYRSKSEELINFSNYAFYDANIQIAPNVEPLKSPAAIEWQKVKGMWVNQSNLLEAIEVVKRLKQQLVADPSLSVGIITFNAKQQEKVMDEIDRQLEQDSEFAVLYHQIQSRDLDERIFVKNIENVQGDERDVIIFSIGYAPAENGRIYNRFGPLGQSGGENRLNVAVSRAKTKTIVISSIEPNELDVTNSKNRGPKLFQAYLTYAKAVSELNHDLIAKTLQDIREGGQTSTGQQPLHFDSGFEVQVYEALTKRGYEVHTQVGLSGYRIDLAIVDPTDSTKYLLGVECDGATYHSSPNAKERDVYRQRFLESRGWKIERIWSRNWWKNPGAEIQRIETVIKEIQKKI
ncbi:MAG: AAA domain-containing protein [Culicoidibacterales bacterium]